MRRALQLALRGRGHVEPNPLVGCVVWRDGRVVGEGWHQRFGGPHAEIEALARAGDQAAGSTVYVTLEPCCHHGKTPPCSEALIAARPRRVVVAMRDPFPRVDGGGLDALRQAGIDVEVGVLEEEARRLAAPYLKLVMHHRPWVIAKWAMTLDGRIATPSGNSRWISGEASRAEVHRLRGRVDAILVGSNTAAVDDPLLTARPPGPRAATRIVMDGAASLSPESQLARTAADVPVIVAVAGDADPSKIKCLAEAGCEVLHCAGSSHAERLARLLDELGRRQMTNLLVEGGSRLLGGLFDQRMIDEVYVFVAPKLIGGGSALSPLAGLGLEPMSAAVHLQYAETTAHGDDLCIHGLVQYVPPQGTS